jgi:pilus assembly protein CpaB
MKTAHVVVLGIALAASGMAVYLVRNMTAPAPEQVAAPSVDMVKVLVAATDINVGTALGPQDIKWQDWPASAASNLYIIERDSPNGIQDWTGAVARAPFAVGEPVRAQKLIKGNGSGFLSAILPAGMRAVATKIAVDTAAGGFILPNDRVDVILTRRDAEVAKQTGVEAWTSETILKNVRVLAIDQTVEDKDGQKVITGSTATIELAPQQTEVLALGKEMGAISLSLRSLADSAPNAVAETSDANAGMKGLSIVRYGVVSTIVNR